MRDRDDLKPSVRSETVHILRAFRDDVVDEIKFVGLLLAVMVPAGLVGYLVNGSTGAFYGAVAGAGLVAVWLAVVAVGMAVSVARAAIGWWRRRSG